MCVHIVMHYLIFLWTLVILLTTYKFGLTIAKKGKAAEQTWFDAKLINKKKIFKSRKLISNTKARFSFLVVYLRVAISRTLSYRWCQFEVLLDEKAVKEINDFFFFFYETKYARPNCGSEIWKLIFVPLATKLNGSIQWLRKVTNFSNAIESLCIRIQIFLVWLHFLVKVKRNLKKKKNLMRSLFPSALIVGNVRKHSIFIKTDNSPVLFEQFVWSH